MKIISCIGTRPEAVKMAPIISLLNRDVFFDHKLILTGQHKELIEDIFPIFGIKEDLNLNLMTNNQSLSDITSSIISSLSKVFEREKPDFVLAQGDTTTVFCCALVCFYNKIKFGHVEAGLRTNNKYFPFPEEVNRVLVSHLTDYHFSPTENSKENLLKEGIQKDKIFVVGNTIVDSVLHVSKKIKTKIQKNKIFLTAHRRENFGKPLEDIFSAIKEILSIYPNIEITYPIHPNPNVKNYALEFFKDIQRINLIDPLNYYNCIKTMKESSIIITDSGGIQEESSVLKKPILILRNETERPEILEHGMAKLVGSNKKLIIEEISKLLTNKSYYKSMVKNISPFGDGTSSKKIIKIIKGI
jgi:UDP-N-acetylglucosamine 2-epimerase (non-hydrolysing)